MEVGGRGKTEMLRRLVVAGEQKTIGALLQDAEEPGRSGGR